MTDPLENLHHRKVSHDTFTPLPKHMRPESPFKRIFFISLIPLFIIGIGIAAYFQYQQYLMNLDGAIGSTADEYPPTPTPVATMSATLAPYVGSKSIPSDWTLKKSQTCGVSLPIPPAEEPYIIPRDPNTPPSALEDEGKYWLYEEIETELFAFNQMVRAIFKNPEAPSAGYVSSAVEVYCADNSDELSTNAFMTQLETDLKDNFSVVTVKEIIDDNKWDRIVKVARFQGGTFGNEQYFLFTTDDHIYMVKAYGETTDPDINAVREEIFAKLRFE